MGSVNENSDIFRRHIKLKTTSPRYLRKRLEKSVIKILT